MTERKKATGIFSSFFHQTFFLRAPFVCLCAQDAIYNQYIRTVNNVKILVAFHGKSLLSEVDYFLLVYKTQNHARGYNIDYYRPGDFSHSLSALSKISKEDTI